MFNLYSIRLFFYMVLGQPKWLPLRNTSTFFMFIFSFLFIIQSNFAQESNVLVMGTIEGNTQKEIVLEIDKRYLDNTFVEYGSQINSNGTYGIACQLELPQLVQLKYNQKIISVFLEPNDTLILNFAANDFPIQMEWKGRAKDNNILWASFRAAFPEDTEVFKYRQYRKGVFYYKVHEDWDKIMQAAAPEQYMALIRREQMQKEGFIGLYKNQTGKQLSPNFINYLNAEIQYTYWYKYLSYGHIYKGRHRLDSTFLGFMDTLRVYQNDAAISNPAYQTFVQASVNYWCEQRKVIPDNVYTQQYYVAKERLSDMTKYFTMAHLTELAFRKENPEVVLAIYEDFLQVNPYLELDKLVVDALQQTRKFAAGTPAPTLSLYDVNGNLVSLRDFQGKVIYINFWASWCRPCIQKLHRIKAIQEEFTKLGVVFLNISIDQNETVWKRTLTEQQFGGIHLFSSPKSKAVIDYQVLAVPRYFILTKEGNFAFTPTSTDETTLTETLRSLLER